MSRSRMIRNFKYQNNHFRLKFTIVLLLYFSLVFWAVYDQEPLNSKSVNTKLYMIYPEYGLLDCSLNSKSSFARYLGMWTNEGMKKGFTHSIRERDRERKKSLESRKCQNSFESRFTMFVVVSNSSFFRWKKNHLRMRKWFFLPRKRRQKVVIIFDQVQHF